MPRFSYQALDADGRRIAGDVEALSISDATAGLSRRGLLPLNVTVLDRPASLTGASDRRQLGIHDLAALVRQLATLLTAAVPVDEALRLVASLNPRAQIGKRALGLAEQITAGRSLSQATSEGEAPFPAHVVALIAAGESRGDVGAALAQAADLLERGVAARARIRAALVYPAVLLLVALMATAIVVLVLVPALMPLFQDAGRPPPTALAWADALSSGIAVYWPLLLVVISLLLVAVRMMWRQPRVRTLVDARSLQLPVLGRLLRSRDTAASARTLGTLLAAGVPLTDGLRLTAAVPGNSRFQASLLAAAERVKEGGALSRALADDGVFDPLAVNFIALGESSSRVDRMLLHLADVTEAESTRRIDAVLALLSPVLTVLIGALVGALILSVMQAILSVNDLVGR